MPIQNKEVKNCNVPVNNSFAKRSKALVAPSNKICQYSGLTCDHVMLINVIKDANISYLVRKILNSAGMAHEKKWKKF